MMKALLILSLLTLMQDRPSVKGDLKVPDIVKECLEQAEVKGKLEIRTAKSPYILKGDFDGDKLSDYAVAIRGPKTRRNGVLVCTAKKQAFILGADMPKDPPFSDMPNDNFVAPTWKVMAKQDALKIYNYDGDKPIRAASPRGDSIAMIWEDAICLIYWDGSRYRWGCGQ
jgi:hypothetical protein